MSLVPEGIHTVRARTWTFKPLAKGGYFLALQCVTEGGPPGLTGGRASWSLFFDERQGPTSLQVLRAIGWNGDHPEDCHDNGGGLDRHPVQVVVAHRSHNDRTFAVVDRMLFEDEEMRRGLSEFFRGVTAPPARKPTQPEPSDGSSNNNLDV